MLNQVSKAERGCILPPLTNSPKGQCRAIFLLQRLKSGAGGGHTPRNPLYFNTSYSRSCKQSQGTIDRYDYIECAEQYYVRVFSIILALECSQYGVRCVLTNDYNPAFLSNARHRLDHCPHGCHLHPGLKGEVGPGLCVPGGNIERQF